MLCFVKNFYLRTEGPTFRHFNTSSLTRGDDLAVTKNIYSRFCETGWKYVDRYVGSLRARLLAFGFDVYIMKLIAISLVEIYINRIVSRLPVKVDFIS